MRIKSLLTCSVISVLLAGCASSPSSLDTQRKADETKGVLMASVTADGNRWVNDAWFYFRKAGSTKEQRLEAFGLGLFGKPNDFPSDRNRRGRLLAIPLEPGDYELVSWTLYIQQLGGYAYISPTQIPPPLKFSVSPGRITYLGGLHIDTAMGRNVFGMPVPGGAVPRLRDMGSADLQVLRRKYPDIADWPLDICVPDGTAWLAGK